MIPAQRKSNEDAAWLLLPIVGLSACIMGFALYGVFCFIALFF